MGIVYKVPKMRDFQVASMTRDHKPAIGDATRAILVHSMGAQGSFLSEIGNRGADKFIYVYHYEKQRARFSPSRNTTKRAEQGLNKKGRDAKKIRDKSWTLRIFKFPAARVKKVEQFKHHFKIELL